MRQKISAHVDGGLSGGSRVRRPRSEDPHRRERKFPYQCVRFPRIFCRKQECQKTYIFGARLASLGTELQLGMCKHYLYCSFDILSGSAVNLSNYNAIIYIIYLMKKAESIS